MAARPRRLDTFDYRGLHRYFLTWCTVDRHRAFAAAPAVDEVLKQIRRTCAEEQFALLAYCFMPDHVHLLLDGLMEDADLRRCVKLARQRSAIQYRRRARRALWQEGFFERVLRDEESTTAVVRYIVANPVRAGLVGLAVDYPFSGSDVCDLRELCHD